MSFRTRRFLQAGEESAFSESSVVGNTRCGKMCENESESGFFLEAHGLKSDRFQFLRRCHSMQKFVSLDFRRYTHLAVFSRINPHHLAFTPDLDVS